MSAGSIPEAPAALLSGRASPNDAFAGVEGADGGAGVAGLRGVAARAGPDGEAGGGTAEAVAAAGPGVGAVSLVG